MSLLDEFKFPELSKDSKSFLSQQFSGQTVEPGVTNIQVSGHEKKGLAYRFYLHPVKSEAKSKDFDMEINDEIEMVEWFKDRKHKPVERVKELPEQLLRFSRRRVSVQNGIEKFEYMLSYTDTDGKEKEDLESVVKGKGLKGKLICKSGIYADDYRRFQSGLGALGLPLSRWGHATLAQVKTLESEGIFTVQQFAALPLDRVEGRFPKDLIELFNKAVHSVNAEARKADITPFANEVLAVRQENSKLQGVIQTLQKQMEGLMAGVGPKKRGRKPKAVSEIENMEAKLTSQMGNV